MSEFKHIYCLYGFTIGSELELPELSAAPAGSAPDVLVRVGRLPAGLDVKPTRFPYLHTLGSAALLEFSEVGRYLLADGTAITIEPAEPINAGEVRAWLYGIVMGMLCLQRRLLPLHASAVAFGNDVFAFCGDSGAGKSTLAAHCLAAGAELITDDLLILAIDASGGITVNPGMPRLRLWRDALHDLGRTTNGLTPDQHRVEKYYVPTNRQLTVGGKRLSAIYLLKADDAAGDGVVSPISGVDTVAALLANTFLPEFIDAAGCRTTHFEFCVRLASSVPLLRLSRQRDPRWLPQTVRRLAEKKLVPARHEASQDNRPAAPRNAVGVNPP